MSNILERFNPKTKLIIGITGAIVALISLYVIYQYDTGIIIGFISGFSSALSLYMLATYKSNAI